jgi:hypothetical protein
VRQQPEIFFSGCLVRAAILFSLLSGILAAGTVHAQTWQVFETKYLRINYLSLEDLRQFDRQIKYSESRKSGFFSFFSGASRATGSREKFEQQLTEKVDGLFEKVQTILDMRKPVKVNVQLYPSQAALHEAYYMIYGKHNPLRAWYIFEFNTIYLNVQDLFDGMFAHECAHAIIDHFFEIRPPRATAEILAQYVDTHLSKDARTY